MEDEYEIVELEYSEDDILYYLVDEDDVEVGFVIADESGNEVECYYEGFDSDEYEIVEEVVEAPAASAAEEAGEPPVQKKPKSYAGKIAAIAGAELGKARDKAEVKVDELRAKAEVHVDKASEVAQAQAKKAAQAAKDQAKKAKAKADEYDLGITREGVAETTDDLNAIMRDGAEVAGELKAAYDDIVGSFKVFKK